MEAIRLVFQRTRQLWQASGIRSIQPNYNCTTTKASGLLLCTTTKAVSLLLCRWSESSSLQLHSDLHALSNSGYRVLWLIHRQHSYSANTDVGWRRSCELPIE